MIQIRGLRKHFAEHQVLSGIDAEVQKGQVVGIVGPSGCGKSTLLRCLNGLEPFQQGSVSIAGFDLGPQKVPPAMLKRLRGAVGMVFQDFQLFPHLTALENVTLAPRVVRGMSAADAEKKGLELLDRVGLKARAAAHPGQLSGGQKQRVAIARALAQGVRVLLLDEPTSALDPEMREEVRQVLRQVAQDGGADGEPLTMLLVTHDMRLATELAQHLWVMAEGKISRSGSVAELAEYLQRS